MVSASVASPSNFRALSDFGWHLGLAFQIQDDILDVESTTTALGKKTGADASLAKPTYPSVFGLSEARRLALEASDRAIGALAPIGARADPLRELARFVVTRSS